MSTSIKKFAVIPLFLILGFIFWVTYTEREILMSAPSAYDLQPETEVELPVGPLVRIGEEVVFVELATSNEAVQKGLSGREVLGPQSGMLFVFKTPARYQFWMPDMKFPLDIIWIEGGRVVDITENVTHEFDHESPKFYMPTEPVRYVLEVNAGFAKNKGIKINDQVSFDIE